VGRRFVISSVVFFGVVICSGHHFFHSRCADRNGNPHSKMQSNRTKDQPQVRRKKLLCFSMDGYLSIIGPERPSQATPLCQEGQVAEDRP